jgi:methyl-accepting chemotaxis protein
VAQRFVQDADQLHDALHADVLQALVVGDGPVAVPEGSTETVRAHAAAFLENLRQARTVALPTDLSAAVWGLWPVQERYAVAAEQLVGLAGRDPAAARAGLVAFTATLRAGPAMRSAPCVCASGRPRWPRCSVCWS